MRLADATRLAQTGRFLEALRILDSGSATTSEKVACDVLKVTLLERTGGYPASRHLAEKLLRSRNLSPSYQSDCRFALGMIDWDEGKFDTASGHYARALTLAREGGDAHRACWILLRQLVVNCGRVTPEAAATTIAEARREVTKLGNPVVSAALQVMVGLVAAKHGAVQTSRRLTLLGRRLLDYSPNIWLQATAENNLAGIAVMDGDFVSARQHASLAEQLARESGAIGVRRASLGNLGNLYFLEGELDKARDCYQRAASEVPTEGEYNVGLLESVARLHLLENRLDAAKECLDAIDAAIHSPSDATAYAHRHTQHTRAVLLHREGAHDAALRQLAIAQELADRSGDRLLRISCQLTRAEILSSQADHAGFVRLLDSLAPALPTLPTELSGHYERVMAAGLAAADRSEAHSHFTRAERTFEALHHRPGQLELHRAWCDGPRVTPNGSACGGAAGEHAYDKQPVSAVVQDTVAALMHAGKPELLAQDLVAVLLGTRAVASAQAVTRHSDGQVVALTPRRKLACPPGTMTLPERTYAVGRVRDCNVEVSCEPLLDTEAVAAVNAVVTLLHRAQDLARAAEEREERLGLWPVEELSEPGEDAVITGAMLQVMRLARKVAPTNATVLITGESGTGKEIVARALHRFSNRNGRPFVPFNCTAVPRDLLESQLFGYRRGAFTGAERDHPGLIRAAKDGTLFLDEVGELAPELQPKLLRFLESGEISPLGESEPVVASARVVAATNANLETLVQEGKFRSDLFYRLRVIPLPLPPLRERRDEIPHLARHFVNRAAFEYGKGQLRIDDELMELLVLNPWPGNIRQLNNELRRMVALADNDATLTTAMVSPEVMNERPRSVAADGAPAAANESLAQGLARLERHLIATALRKHHGRVDPTAKALGISRKGLYLKRQRFGL